MRLRNLEKKDAEFMLEWMHDDYVVENLQTDFHGKTLEDCERFIADSILDKQNIHMAIVDDNDCYEGTVSLKNIERDSAEFAITIRKCAMGKGISQKAMEQIIEYGFNNLGLNSIYWCVSPKNTRAIRFYDKNKYSRISADKLKISGDYSEGQIKEYIWYQKEKKFYKNVRGGKL